MQGGEGLAIEAIGGGLVAEPEVVGRSGRFVEGGAVEAGESLGDAADEEDLVGVAGSEGGDVGFEPGEEDRVKVGGEREEVEEGHGGRLRGKSRGRGRFTRNDRRGWGGDRSILGNQDGEIGPDEAEAVGGWRGREQVSALAAGWERDDGGA